MARAEQDDWDFGEDEESGGLVWLAAVRDPMGVLRRQFRWMLASLVPLLLVAAAAVVFFPNPYEARGTILLSAKSIPDEFVPTTIIANILEQFEAIRGEVFTRDSLAKIITETGLYSDETSTVPMSSLAARLAEDLTVKPISGQSRSRSAPRSIAFEVALTAQDPQIAANVVNTTISALINANLEYRSRQARVTTNFMRREFDRANEALTAHQQALAAFRSENRGSLPEEQEASLAKLERLEDQRRSAILQLGDFQSQLERANLRSDTGMPVESGLDSLRIRLENARAVYTEDHPTVKSLERQMAAMAERDANPQPDSPMSPAAYEERARIEKGIELEQLRLRQIDEDVSRLEEKLAAAPGIADDYAALLRRETILQENYLEYLRKLNNAELALSLESAQQGAQLTRLDPAIPPSAPKLPQWMLAAGGLVLAFGGALAIGLLREILLSVVVDQQHLEDAIPLPCLGSVSRVT